MLIHFAIAADIVLDNSVQELIKQIENREYSLDGRGHFSDMWMCENAYDGIIRGLLVGFGSGCRITILQSSPTVAAVMVDYFCDTHNRMHHALLENNKDYYKYVEWKGDVVICGKKIENFQINFSLFLPKMC